MGPQRTARARHAQTAERGRPARVFFFCTLTLRVQTVLFPDRPTDRPTEKKDAGDERRSRELVDAVVAWLFLRLVRPLLASQFVVAVQATQQSPRTRDCEPIRKTVLKKNWVERGKVWRAQADGGVAYYRTAAWRGFELATMRAQSHLREIPQSEMRASGVKPHSSKGGTTEAFRKLWERRDASTPSFE